MASKLKTRTLRIGGMTCVHCQKTIENKLRGLPGVNRCNVKYSAGTAEISYDESIVSMEKISAAIESAGYHIEKHTVRRAASLLLIIAALYMLLEHFGILTLLAPGRLAEANTGYGMLFVIGLLTSVHCMAMCGGINLSQCIPKENPTSTFGPAALYNLGRVISYTVVGFMVGALGSVISFSSTTQGILKLIAGIFMIVMGVNMLGIFPWLRKITPRLPKLFRKRGSAPFIVGLLGGLMPCGPLQAMQIYALSTGNPFTGALSMMLFSLGTVPLMFGLGAVSSALGRKFTKNVLTVGAVLVVVLGLSMLTQGFSLSGNPMTTEQTAKTIPVQTDLQEINSTLSARRYPDISVKAGVPVRWIIDAPENSINGCNYAIYIPEYGIEHVFQPGENVIEFTPDKTGRFAYSCWMGMIRATINVTN